MRYDVVMRNQRRIVPVPAMRGVCQALCAALAFCGLLGTGAVRSGFSVAFADLLPAPSPTKPAASVLTIEVTNVEPGLGQVTVLLFASADGFPGKEEKAIQRTSVPASAAAVSLRLPQVPPGTYAVTVYQDRNSNNRLDKNWIGLPKESVAVSNNVKGRMGPPKWSAASFPMGAAHQSIAITLNRL